MNDNLQTKYQEALRELLARKGRPVRIADDRDLYFGWTDWEALDHVRGYGSSDACSVTIEGIVEEVSWQEFKGTFSDDDSSVHGLRGMGSCQCGEIGHREFRYETTISEAISSFFEILNMLEGELDA